jgi:hypothetical protein
MSRFVVPSCIVLALTAFVGCSLEGGRVADGDQSALDGSVSFRLLTTSSVQIDSVGYEVDNLLGADSVIGSFTVPADPSLHVPVLGVQSLSPGDYGLTLSAIGTRLDGTSIPCTSIRTAFRVNGGSDTFIGDISLSCIVQVDPTTVPTADVPLDTVPATDESVVETFSYGPRTAQGENVGGACWFPAIALNVDHTNAAVHYSWTVMPDGTFTLNSSNTSGSYRCASAGDKTLTITGTLNGQSSMKSFTVSCAPCP